MRASTQHDTCCKRPAFDRIQPLLWAVLEEGFLEKDLASSQGLCACRVDAEAGALAQVCAGSHRSQLHAAGQQGCERRRSRQCSAGGRP